MLPSEPAVRLDAPEPPRGALRATRVLIALRGELDLSDAESLRQQLGKATPSDDVVVDVSGVPFIDSVALGVLARAAVTHRERGGRVVLAGARPFVRKLLALTRLGGVLPDAATVEQAHELLDSFADEGPVAVEAWRTGVSPQGTRVRGTA